MGFCTRRHFLLSICFLQLISTVERQVFDFMGYMWIPILVNFFEIIFVIFGFFGTFQYRPKYIISYSIWNFILLAWNIFLISLYLDIGILNHKESKVLKLDPDSSSWWMTNGPGCQATFNTTASIPVVEAVTGCLLNYVHVEVFHAGFQCLLSFLGFMTGLCLSKSFMEEDDSSSHNATRKPSKRTSLYSIEFSPQHEIRQADSDGDSPDCIPPPISPKPMTPRRVKRRSVMQRGTSSRHSTASRRHGGARSSTRNNRSIAQNPVTRIINEQQQKTSNYDDSVSPSGSPPEPLPMYYNSVSNSELIAQQHHWQVNGHTNPTYQQSSTQSLNDHDDLDDLYNNRPASVRSSYSNFHGTRAISYGAPQYYHSHATPQVPQKRQPNIPRQSMRSMAFMNNGPPAYTNTQPQNAVDSETTI